MHTCTIDWLSFTLHPEKGDKSDVLILLAGSGIMEPEHPRFGYDRAARAESGAIILSRSSGIGDVHAIISGSALLALNKSGTDARKLLEMVVQSGAKITRLDLAKDAKDEAFGIVNFEKIASSGRFEGSAHKASATRSSDGGCTVYIGSRQSEKFLRVYDKGVESKQGGDWIRAEIELKGDTSNLIAKAIVDQNLAVNDVFCELARRMCNMQHEGWQNLLKAEGVFSAPKIEKQSDREKWIETQVADAVLKHLEEHPDSKAVERLFMLLRRHYDCD